VIGGYVEYLQVYFCWLVKAVFDVIAEQLDMCIGKNYGTKKLRYKARRWIYERVCKDDLGSYIVTIVYSTISQSDYKSIVAIGEHVEGSEHDWANHHS